MPKESLKSKRERAEKAVELFKKEYPGAVCSLDYTDAFELLVATRLSAQCTDARVNIVTPALFKKFPNAEAMSKADIKEIESLIKSCGLYKTKAKGLKEMSIQIMNEFDGKVPDSMEKLTSLSGIGRKTANLIMGDIYGEPAVVTDTHFIRLCNRLGFINTIDPKKTEDEMRKILPLTESNNFCHRTVIHGRAVCTARKAKCEICCLKEICRQKIKGN